MSDQTMLGNVRLEDGKIRASFLQPDQDVIWFDLEPDVAAAFGVALLGVAQPSIWQRLATVWRERHNADV